MIVNEIFYSLQGEGRYAGTPAVFVRFSGCNLRCSFCDTDYESGREMSEEAIVEAVSEYPARHVILTGGEPTLQLTASLAEKLHAAGCTIHLETNGTRPLPEGCRIDWITCSPKAGGSVVIRPIDELKVVFLGSDPATGEPVQDMAQYDCYEAKEYRLQPCDVHDAERNRQILKDTIAYALAHPRWNLSLQTHKMIHVR